MPTKITCKLKNKKGSVLGVTLVTSFMMVLLSAGFLNLLISDSRQTKRHIYGTEAMHTAEAGVELGFWEIKHHGAQFLSASQNTENNWVQRSANEFFKSGTLINASGKVKGEYDILIIKDGSNNYLIKSIGYVPSKAEAKAHKMVQVKVDYNTFPPYALFAGRNIDIASNVFIDSYVGTYDQNNPGTNGDIGTNSTDTGALNIAGGSGDIKGEGFIGPSGDTSTAINDVPSPNNKLDGENVLTQTASLPPPSPPGGLTDKGALNITSSNVSLNSSGQYSSIVLNSSSLTFTADAEIHVTGELVLNTGSQIIISNGASVSIYVDGRMDFNSNAGIDNVSGNPSKFSLLGTEYLVDTLLGDPGVDFDSNFGPTDFYGIIYAPNATVNIDSNNAFYGSIIGDVVNINSNAMIHYDEDLQNYSSSLFGYLVQPGFWLERDSVTAL